MCLLRHFLSSYSTSLLFFPMHAPHLTHLISYFSSIIIWEDETQLLLIISVQMHHLCLGQNIYFSTFIDGWLLIAAYSARYNFRNIVIGNTAININTCNGTNNFHIRTVHLDVIGDLFIYQLMHKKFALKGILKFTLKQLQQVSVQSPSSGSALFELAKIT